VSGQAPPPAALPSEIERAQNLAAVKALEAYAACMQEMLGDSLRAADLHERQHVHTAVMLVGACPSETAVALVAHWYFSADPEVIKRVLAADSKKHKGSG
jgi:hypothetical protein